MHELSPLPLVVTCHGCDSKNLGVSNLYNKNNVVYLSMPFIPTFSNHNYLTPFFNNYIIPFSLPTYMNMEKQINMCLFMAILCIFKPTYLNLFSVHMKDVT